jgi:proline iminopeptidase
MKQATLLSLMAFNLFGCKNLTNTTQPLTVPSTAPSTCAIKTGGNQMIEVDGKYHVWTKKTGDGKIKVLLLHGGPGFSHDYFECYEDFLPKEGMTIYYYDQYDDPKNYYNNLTAFLKEVDNGSFAADKK